MEKKFSLDQLDKTSPFRVPEGYFESLTSRVMAALPEEPAAVEEMKKDGKVVGMIPRKRRQDWKRWAAVAAAACVCGLVFFLAKPTDKAETSGPVAQKKVETSAEPEVANLPVKASEPETKVYANAAYDLQTRGRRSSASVESAPQTLMASVETPKVVTPVATAAPKAVKASNAVAESQPKAVKAVKVEPTVTSIDIAASDVDQYAKECDVVDYTQMGGSDIYDYLAGVEYY